MKRLSIRYTTLALAALACLALGISGPVQAQSAAPLPGKTYRIGYSQIVDHPALNATRQGFLDGLRDAGFVQGKNLDFEYQNAQGDVGNARNIADKFISDRVDLLAACTTPNAQATIKVAHGSTVPVIFGCVTDPVGAGLLASLDKPTGTNVTGVYGAQPVVELMDLLTQVVPKARTIGTVYNNGEPNSASADASAKAAAAQRGLKWVEAPVTTSADVKTAVDSLVGRVDVIYTVQDNTVASAYDAVVKATRDNHIPLFSLDTTSVERGALAAYGVDQYKLGVAWAKEVAVPILLGQNPATFVPVAYKTYDLYLNTATATTDGLTIPPAVMQKVVKSYDK